LTYFPTFTMFINLTVTRAILLLLLQANLLGFAPESYMAYASRGDVFMQGVSCT